MALGPGGGDGGQRGPAEIVQFGRSVRPRRYRLGALPLACLIAAAVVLVIVRSGSNREAASPPPVAVTDAGHPILGVRAGWQLFGFDGSAVVAVQFARGRIVRTTIPRLEGDGLVSLVAARGEALVRPLDNVPGYVVPDGEPARRLTGALAHGGTLLPGPGAAEQWLDGDGLVLVGPRGQPEHPSLPESALLWATQVPVISDGRGGLVLTGAAGAVYDAGPGGLRRIDALPLAVGPRNWLGLACGQGSCHDVVISTITWASRALPGRPLSAYPWPWQGLQGVISPDGTTAALIVHGQVGGQAGLDLISLRSGVVVRTSVPVARDASAMSLAWSPDGTWLFAVTARGTLAAVDARTGRSQFVNFGLSGLKQIVIRPAVG